MSNGQMLRRTARLIDILEGSRFEHPVFSQDHAAVITYLDDKASPSADCAPGLRCASECKRIILHGEVGDLLARLKALKVDKNTLVTQLVSHDALLLVQLRPGDLSVSRSMCVDAQLYTCARPASRPPTHPPAHWTPFTP